MSPPTTQLRFFSHGVIIKAIPIDIAHAWVANIPPSTVHRLLIVNHIAHDLRQLSRLLYAAIMIAWHLIGNSVLIY
jgi:hypothetical protein